MKIEGSERETKSRTIPSALGKNLSSNSQTVLIPDLIGRKTKKPIQPAINKVEIAYCIIEQTNNIRMNFRSRGKYIINDIINAPPTDGLWDDSRNDESQLGLTYKQIEEAMENSNSKYFNKYNKFRKKNLHKMIPIPVCEIKDK